MSIERENTGTPKMTGLAAGFRRIFTAVRETALDLLHHEPAFEQMGNFVNIGRKRFPNGSEFRFRNEAGWHLTGRMETGKIGLCKALQEGKEGDTACLIFVEAEEIVQWNPELFEKQIPK
jgi:hypothetical protein